MTWADAERGICDILELSRGSNLVPFRPSLRGSFCENYEDEWHLQWNGQNTRGTNRTADPLGRPLSIRSTLPTLNGGHMRGIPCTADPQASPNTWKYSLFINYSEWSTQADPLGHPLSVPSPLTPWNFSQSSNLFPYDLCMDMNTEQLLNMLLAQFSASILSLSINLKLNLLNTWVIVSNQLFGLFNSIIVNN